MAGNDKIRISVEGDSDDLQAALRRSRESIKGVGDESDRQTTRAGRVFDRLRAKLAKPIKAKVEAETKQAESRLEGLHARIKQIEREKLELKASADTTQADARLSALRGEIKKLEREKIKPDADTAAAEAKIQGLLAQVEELNRQRLNIKARADTSGADAELRKLRSEVAGVRSEMARLPSEAKRSFGGLNGAVAKTNRGFQFLSNGMRLLRWPLLATGAGMAGQALSAATAGATGLLGSLVPLSSSLAAIPAFAGAAAQGMGVWKFATGGIAEALGGLNAKLADTKAQKAAFKGLSDEAKDFARDLEKMKPKILALQHVAQRGLLPGLREGLREAMENFPVVERLIDRTAKALGGMAAKAGKALGSAEWGRDIETIGTRNVRIMTTLGDAAGNVANAIRHIAVASGPTMERLAKDVAGFTSMLEKAAAAGRKSGKLGDFFERGRERAGKLVGILGHVVIGLGRILNLGDKHMGGPLLDDLAEVSKRFDKWTRSAKGQNSIREYFTRARPAVSELGRTVAALGKAFLRMGSAPGLAKTFATIRTRLIPALERMLTTLANAAGPDVINALASLADLFAAIAPHVARVMSVVAKLVGGLADLIRQNNGIGMLAGAFVTVAGAVAAVKFVGMITGLTRILGLIRGIRTAAPAAAAGIGGIAARNAAVAGGGGLAAGAGGGAAGGGAMAALRKWGGRGLKFVGGRAILPVGIAITAAQGMQALGMKWFKPIENLKRAARLAFNALPRDAQRAFSRVGGQVVAGLRAVPGRIAAIFRPIPGRVAGFFRALPSRIGAIFRSIPGRARGFVIGFARLAGTAVGRVITVFWRLGGRIVGAVRGIPGRVGRVFNGIGRFASRAVANVAGYFRRLPGRVVGAVRALPGRVGRLLTSVGRWASRAVSDVGRFFARLPGRVLGVIRPLPGRVGRVFRSLVSPAGSAVASIVRAFASLPGRALRALGGLIGGMARLARDAARAFIRSLMGSLPRKLRRFAGFATGGIAVGFAGGGTTDSGGTPALMDKFSGAPTRKSTGGRHSRPTYLVGEENRPEFVIATNPAYRKANLEYLSMAAAALKAPMVPAFAAGGRTEQDQPYRGGDFTPWRVTAARHGARRAEDGGGSKFLSFSVSAGFAKGGRWVHRGRDEGKSYGADGLIRAGFGRWRDRAGNLYGETAKRDDERVVPIGRGGKRTGRSGGGRGSVSAEDRANFQYANPTPRARPFRGQMRVRGPRGRWIEPLRYSLEGARERESFYEELGEKQRGGRSSREWRALSKSRRARITKFWESRSDRVGKLHEFWERRFEFLNELWGQLGELRGERRGQAALGRRVQGPQLGVMRDFAGQYVGRYAQGGPISLPRSFGSTGIAEVHRGERVVPDPRGGYGSQVAVAGQGGPVKVDVTIGFDDRGMLKIVDQRIEGRAADVSSREIGRRTRRIASAPGARRPTYAR